MAPRIGFTIAALRRMQPDATEFDARVVWKKDERLNVSILIPEEPATGCSFDGWKLYQLGRLVPREMRLIARQLNELADEYERDNAGERYEEILP